MRHHGYAYEVIRCVCSAHLPNTYAQSIQEFEVTTEDGFILDVQHVFKEHSSNGYTNGYEKGGCEEESDVDERGQSPPPVILCHGLMQCSSVFVVNEDDSLAYHLVDSGLE